jgi:hypothetical protein
MSGRQAINALDGEDFGAFVDPVGPEARKRPK